MYVMSGRCCGIASKYLIIQTLKDTSKDHLIFSLSDIESQVQHDNPTLS